MDKLPYDNFISDATLAAMFSDKDAGNSFIDALEKAGLSELPEHEKDEVKALWDLYGITGERAKSILLRKELLTATLREIGETALEDVAERTTERAKARYQSKGGSADVIRGANIFQKFFVTNWKLAGGLAVVMLAVAAVSGIGGEPAAGPDATKVASLDTTTLPPENAIPEAAPMAMMAMQTTEPAGDPLDDIFASLDTESSGDAALFNSMLGGAELLTNDSAELSALTNAYDETAL